MLAIRCSLRFVLPLVFVAMCCDGAAEAAAPDAAVFAGGAAPRPVVLSEADWKRVVRREVSSARIDELLDVGEKGKPASVSDETFLRRVSLDVAGSLPEAKSLRAFVADSDPAKRSKKIDELLASEAYARHWARYWRDVVSARLTLRRTMGLTRSFEEWLFERFRAGDDWRTIVRAILTAQGELRFTLNTPSAENGQLFFLVAHDGPEAEERAAETSRVFLGIQIQCAQCHDHPTENWKRTQFHDFAAYFARIKYEQLFDKGKLSGVQLVTLKDAEHKMQDLKNPEVFATVSPRFLDGRAPDTKLDDVRRRAALADSVLGHENYWFAAAFVNRVWTELMGSSFYPHIDDLGPMKPVARPEVLLALVGSFQASGYDPRALIRTIVNTEAYQRRLSDASAGDEAAAASAEVLATTSKRLRPDALWDALVHVFGKIEHGARFHTGSGVRFNSSFTEGKFRAEFDFDPSLDVDEVNGTIPQALFLMNNPVLNKQITAAKTSALGKLLRDNQDDAAAIEQLYRHVLARAPTERERKRCLDFAKTAASREEAFEDLLWALINSTEFQRTR